MLDYMRILDVGFRAAVVNGCARARAREDWTQVSRIIATALAYFVVTGGTACTAAILLRSKAIALFNVPLAYRHEAEAVVAIIAIPLALRFMFAPLTAALEAFQRFDILNAVYISALILRSGGSFTVLLAGYGLREMALVQLCASLVETTCVLTAVRKVIPGFRFSFDLVRPESMAGLFRYGRYSAVISATNLVAGQSPTVIIGTLRGPAEVAFFVLPLRLLMYTTEAFSKFADVTSSVAAEFDEARKTDHVWKLAVQTNRLCVTMFMPLAVFLFVFGTQLLRVWVPVGGFSEHSGPLIPILLLPYIFAFAGQYNAGAVLIGQAKHKAYAYAIVIEVLSWTACLFAVVPHYGALGAAWVISIGVTLGRGLTMAILLCRLNGFKFREYVTAIYASPILTAVPVLALALAIHRFVWTGRNWLELILTGLILAGTYFGLAVFTVLDAEYRTKLLNRFLPRSQNQVTST